MTVADPNFVERLRRNADAEILFDAYSRARYSTDASIYQIEPLGVVVPRTPEAAEAAIAIACESQIPVLPRGAGTSQCGQTVGRALVIDNSKYLREIHSFDPSAGTVWVEPGVVLDALNAWLKPHGLWFPVDVSTSAQATIGGMTANNSCGARSISYGNMVHNVLAIEALLSSGERVVLGEGGGASIRSQGLASFVRRLYERERAEIHRRVPRVQRRVAGYNLDMADNDDYNPANILVGSEGTLAWFARIKLRLAPLPKDRVLGVVHFPTFYDAMNLTQDIVRLGPAAVELVDSTMIELARANPAFRATVDKVLRGSPEAILLVEFAGDDAAQQHKKLARLNELMADLRLPGSVVDVLDTKEQSAIWNVRKAGLNIMMSMKGDGKPVSFIEDCAVPLEHLAEYTMRLTRVFEKHGTRGTWYAHASVGCLHVRPVLDMRTQEGADRMRAIAEEACALVQEYKGSYSGEHGDGLVRSEWIERIYGPRLTHAFGEIKQAFDPQGLMNPGKIIGAPRMDQRELFRFPPGYETLKIDSALDWSQFEIGEHNVGRGFAAALEMCNNNGHCRKFDSGTMCPSFRVTRNERDLTRGRANTLRLAMAGHFGTAAITSDALYETMSLCVSCKGCRRECPTGVDMARMKIEFLNQYHRHRPRSARDRLIAHLPQYAPWLARIAPLANLRNSVGALARLAEAPTGISRHRRLPSWQFGAAGKLRSLIRRTSQARPSGRDVVLLPDTFSIWFEPENLSAAADVLTAAGYRVIVASHSRGRPLCCGRTYLASGMVEEARAEAKRTLEVIGPFASRGVPIVGLEPSCLFGFHDEIPNIVAGDQARAVARHSMTFAQFIASEARAGRWPLEFAHAKFERALVHGHCHEKAFDAFDDVLSVLRMVPGLDVRAVESSCCGMAGAFGYSTEHFDVSMRMGEASLLPEVRAADADTVIVADGTSCRHQIEAGAERSAVHLAVVLAAALSGGGAAE